MFIGMSSMMTQALRYFCAGVCGVDGCPMEFQTDKELTMHYINGDETQVQNKRPFCAQCFMIFDDSDNQAVHQCQVGKAQAQISMALSQCDTTIIDLTVGGHLGEDFCSFRHETWSVSKAPRLSRGSSSSLDEGTLDETVIPAAAAKKRKSSTDLCTLENTRKSPRLEAKMSQVTSPVTTLNKPCDSVKLALHETSADAPVDMDNTVISGDLEVKKEVLSPIKFGPESTHTPSLSNPRSSARQRNRVQNELHKPTKPGNTTSTPLIVQPQLQIYKSRLASASLLPSIAKVEPEASVHPTKHTPVIENIGIFWDIENIAIPPDVSVSSLVRKIRNTFVTEDKREVEFMCVCDVHKEKRHIIDELNSCNVTIVHVNCFAKNAADEKLKHYLHRFAQTYPSPSTTVVLSGDVNFAPVLSNLTCFYTLNTVLIHNVQCSARLKDSAKSNILFDEFIQGIGPTQHTTHNRPSFLLLDKFPRMSYAELYNRLDRMCDNTGGKIVNLDAMMGVVKFSTLELCVRAQRRLNNHCLRPGMPPIRARFSPETIKTFK